MLITLLCPCYADSNPLIEILTDLTSLLEIVNFHFFSILTSHFLSSVAQPY